jgi:hypothetical protein
MPRKVAVLIHIALPLAVFALAFECARAYREYRVADPRCLFSLPGYTVVHELHGAHEPESTSCERVG